jgi:branched-chain amino acid transport system ATP-binding protein
MTAQPALTPHPIELRAIEHRYGVGVTALSGINLAIKPGSFTLVLGPNGAGKTTLANIMGGMLKPSEGAVLVWGHPARFRDGKAFNSSGIVLVPERRRLFYRLTVRENILLGAYSVKGSRAELNSRLQHLLELFPSALSQRLDFLAGSISGGEQQLVAVARALIANPRVVILDEPSLGLAPMAIESVYNLLVTASRGGATLVVIEQSGAIAMRHATHVAVLDGGRQVHFGPAGSITPEQILEIAYVGRIETPST